MAGVAQENTHIFKMNKNGTIEEKTTKKYTKKNMDGLIKAF